MFRLELQGLPSKRTFTKLYQRHGSLQRPLLYSVVQPTYENTWISILKMDVRPVVSYDHERLSIAIRSTEQRLRIALQSPINWFPDFTVSTSASFPFSTMGFKTKLALFRDPMWFDLVKDPNLVSCIWRVITKCELKLDSEIAEGKIRTVVGVPSHLLWWQKVFYSAQDDKLKTAKFGDIRYGQTFAFGGFHQLMLKHVGRKVLFGDVKGWDRNLCLMRAIHGIREKFLTIPSQLYDMYVWVRDNTVTSTLLLPNGDLVEKDVGNNSGGGTTTSDNCIGHQAINDYIRTYISNLVSDVYGDDFVSSVVIENAKDIFINCYKAFALELKFLEERDGPVGCVFLGATCVQVGEFFVPAYNSEKIYASLVLADKRHNDDEELSKFYALLFLSWNDIDLFNEITEVICRVMINPGHGPMRDHIARDGIPTRDSIIHNFWCGCESSHYGQGFKKLMNENNVVKETIFGEQETSV